MSDDEVEICHEENQYGVALKTTSVFGSESVHIISTQIYLLVKSRVFLVILYFPVKSQILVMLPVYYLGRIMSCT